MVDSTDSVRLLRAVPVPREQDTSAGGYDQCEGYLQMISAQTDGHRPASRVIVQHPQERKGLFSHGYCQQYELNRQCKDETMASGALLSQSERFQEQNLSAFEERWICCLSRGLNDTSSSCTYGLAHSVADSMRQHKVEVTLLRPLG